MGDERLRERSITEPRTVVITGAARGLGFASTVRLYREGLAGGRRHAHT